MQHKKVIVTERALLQRINRRLEPYGKSVKHLRGAAAEASGEFVVVEFERVVFDHIDLERYGRDLGVLKPWEALQPP